MKRLALLFALLLNSCIPTLTPVDPTDPVPPVVFTCAGGECVITAKAEILEAYVAVNGPISSIYCSGGVTAQPRPCEAVVGEWRALDVPPGEYGRRLLVGRVDKVPKAGFADVNLADTRESFRAELTP